jgi:hypothetical protein
LLSGWIPERSAASTWPFMASTFALRSSMSDRSVDLVEDGLGLLALLDDGAELLGRQVPLALRGPQLQAVDALLQRLVLLAQ